MDTWLQTPIFTARPPTPHFRLPEGEAIAPQHLWPLLTQPQQQTAFQTLIQISLEIVQQAMREVRDEHP